MDLPRVKTEQRKAYQGHGCFVDLSAQSFLIKSTGHLKKDGRWQGSDPFHVFKDVENPAFGPSYNASTDARIDGDYYLDTPTFNWYPCLARYFTSTYSYVNEFGSHMNTVDFGTPEPTVPLFSDFVLALNALGTSFIREARPGNPAANLGQFAGELHDVPKIPVLKSKAKFFYNLGDQYLNLMFGWKPFVTDIRKAVRLSTTLINRLDQLVKDNGLDIKRTRTRRTTESVSLISSGSRNRPFANLLVDDNGLPTGLDSYCVLGPFGHRDTQFDTNNGSLTWKYEQVTERLDKYSGIFRYYVPDIGTPEWTARATQALYEFNLTPSVLWEIMPWSWLADWFANVGDIISNLSTNAVDNEVLVDSFVMSKQLVEHRLTVETQWDSLSISGSDGVKFIPAGSATLVHSHSEINTLRQPASPFGFGIDSSAFTPAQWLILAALGLTHQRKL